MNIEVTPTSIDINWTTISDTQGYIVYFDDTAYNVMNSSITVDELIPGTTHLVRVRAYQDILGPASAMVHATTDNGKFLFWL